MKNTRLCGCRLDFSAPLVPRFGRNDGSIDLSFSNIKSSFAQSKTSSTIIFYLLFFILIYPHHSELAEESRRTAAKSNSPYPLPIIPSLSRNQGEPPQRVTVLTRSHHSELAEESRRTAAGSTSYYVYHINVTQLFGSKHNKRSKPTHDRNPSCAWCG